MNFIKSFGLGLVYFFLSPIILLGCVLAGVFGIINYLVQGVIMLGHFFKGQKLFPRFKEDEEAYALQLAQYELKSGVAQAKAKLTEQKSGNTYIQQNYYQQGPNGEPMKIASTPFQPVENNVIEQPQVDNEPKAISIFDEDDGK